MAPPDHNRNLLSSAANSFQSFLSILPFPNPNRQHPPPPQPTAVNIPILLPYPFSTTPPAVRSFASGVRIEGLVSSSKGDGGGGPAFVGQVFSMLDPSGNGLMAVTTRFDIPFLSKRTPEWIKKMIATVIKNEQKGPVFRFFMDLGDAVSYVKHLNIPTGVVGACRLDVAYEHFKEKPHMFQFVPNKKQVKAANDLLRRIPSKSGRRKVAGVPVFTAQNLNIAIATKEGIKWYSPYFFDKSLLDNILEASIDQHFHTLIQNRHVQRRRDVVDDGMSSDVFEEYSDSLFEPPEVQELLDEMGQVGIPLGVISKAAEIQFLDVADKVLLGNKWFRKATGIQPKFPYLVDSFEERTANSYSKVTISDAASANIDDTALPQSDRRSNVTEVGDNGNTEDQRASSSNVNDCGFPFGSWFQNPWSRLQKKQADSNVQMSSNIGLDGDATKEVITNPLLPKVTMVGISMGDSGHVSRANLKKTMEDLTKELEQASQKQTLSEERDPLFIANVGDYSSIMRMNSS